MPCDTKQKQTKKKNEQASIFFVTVQQQTCKGFLWKIMIKRNIGIQKETFFFKFRNKGKVNKKKLYCEETSTYCLC